MSHVVRLIRSQFLAEISTRTAHSDKLEPASKSVLRMLEMRLGSSGCASRSVSKLQPHVRTSFEKPHTQPRAKLDQAETAML